MDHFVLHSEYQPTGDQPQAIEALAEGVKVDFPELYAALQTGKVEVAENPLTNYLVNHFNEVAPNLTLDGHMLGVGQVMISASTWNSLSENQKNTLLEAGKYAQNVCKKILDEMNAEAIATVKANGGTVIEIADKTPWQEACADMISESSKAYPELYKKIVNLGK